MFPAIVVFSILPDFFSGGYAATVNETDIVHYLYRVGELKIREAGQRPHYYFNNSLENWNFNDARVKESVGLICDRMGSEAGIEIKTACELFERTAADFLLRYHVARQRNTKFSNASMVKFYMKYKTVMLYFQQVKELIPLVCKKTQMDLFILLDLKMDDVTQVNEECDRLASDVLTYLKETHQDNLRKYKNGVYESEIGEYGFTFTLVKTTLPRVCDMYYDTTTWQTISGPCEYFFHWTGTMLEYISNQVNQVYPIDAYNNIKMKYAYEHVQIHDVKPFIVNYCGKITPGHKWQVACKYLLKDHMELMMELMMEEN